MCNIISRWTKSYQKASTYNIFYSLENRKKYIRVKNASFSLEKGPLLFQMHQLFEVTISISLEAFSEVKMGEEATARAKVQIAVDFLPATIRFTNCALTRAAFSRLPRVPPQPLRGRHPRPPTHKKMMEVAWLPCPPRLNLPDCSSPSLSPLGRLPLQCYPDIANLMPPLASLASRMKVTQLRKIVSNQKTWVPQIESLFSCLCRGLQ